MEMASVMITVMVIVMILAWIIALSGLTMVIYGIVKRRHDRKNGSRLIITGLVMMIITSLYFIYAAFMIFASSHSTPAAPSDYDSLPEYWQAHKIGEGEASVEAVNTLLDAAYAGDTDKFASVFSESTRRRSDFDARMEDFLSKLPSNLRSVGLKDCGITSRSSEPGSSAHSEATVVYSAVVDGKEYFLTLKFCAHSAEHPEDVGVSFFTVLNLEGQAMYNQCFNEVGGASVPSAVYERYADAYLLCDVLNDGKVSARKIFGFVYMWTPSEGSPMTSEEIVAALAGYDNLADAIDAGKLPQPNVEYKSADSNVYEYYYELASGPNGEPLYASIVTMGERGDIADWSVVE